MDISKQTLYVWTKEKPEFSDAIQRAVDLSEAWWIEKGQDRLDADKFQTGLWYANMKNRFGWRDKTESTVDATVQVSEIVRKIVDPGNPDS